MPVRTSLPPMGQPMTQRRRQKYYNTSSLNGKWCVLLTISMALSVYMVIVTETVHLSSSMEPSLHMDNPLLDFVKSSFSSKVRDVSSTRTTIHRHNVSDTTTTMAKNLEYDGDEDDQKKKKNSSNRTTSSDNQNPAVEERHIPRRKPNNDRRRDRNRAKPPINETEIDWSKYTFEETAMPPDISNMEFYNITSDGEFNLWDHDPTLPYWMKTYFRWHKWKRRTWDLKNWKSERWLIVQCLMDQDKRKCGGTSDRLKPIPTLLRLAYDTKRILLIRWTRPSLLEEFLMPPVGGLDWRVPPAMVDVIHNVSYGKKLSPFQLIDKYTHTGMSLVRAKYQTNTPHLTYKSLVEQDTNATRPDYMARRRMELSSQPDFNQVFHKVWRIFFTPSTPVADIIQNKLETLGLTPHHYVASHLRALYAVDTNDRPEWYIQLYTENALACATQLRPGVPIYFASDSAVATLHALKVGKEKRVSCNMTVFDEQPVAEALAMGVVASIPDPNPPWHLDTMIGPAPKFYDTFVDLYLMALAGCVTHGKGGYGHWALLIGGNVNCTLQQDIIGRRRFPENPCTFTPSVREELKENKDTETLSSSARDSLLMPPMTKVLDGDILR
ncbi:hypothetical protein IV203_023251 [Nitzschia inconspicua]|uniref:O-fucosyltransferase family protein n=1 Tax=Nitzschia inconspicua TaxID=303405 RepID=A0A9K3KCW6_9STRA|nr:hypothetical protein IV203_023251 [Nitzschia inconspicua]